LAFERDEASVSARVNAELASSKVADALHQRKLADDAIAERDSKLKLSQECENRLRAALSDAKSQHAAHEAELSERVVSLEREVSDARSSNDEVQAEIHSLRAMVSSLPSADAAEELASASSELEKLRTSLSSTQEQLQELRQENASLHEQLDARSSEIETARSQTQQQKEKAKTLQQSLDAALKWKGTAESLQQELETSRAMCEKMELQYERMKGKASELEASVNGLQQEREHARSAEAAKGSKLQSAEEQMDRLERKRIEEIQRLEEEKKNALQCYEDERTQRQSLEGRVEAQQNIMSQYESKEDRMQSKSEHVQRISWQKCMLIMVRLDSSKLSKMQSQRLRIPIAADLMARVGRMRSRRQVRMRASSRKSRSCETSETKWWMSATAFTLIARSSARSSGAD
jgi:chromosome segregation ATPase